MNSEAHKILDEVRELAQNACAGYCLRVTGPYGETENKDISETDIVHIVRETDLAIKRLSQAVQKLADYVAEQKN